jgi:hypothetical protein
MPGKKKRTAKPCPSKRPKSNARAPVTLERVKIQESKSNGPHAGNAADMGM